jgi:hypothetical protein
MSGFNVNDLMGLGSGNGRQIGSPRPAGSGESTASLLGLGNPSPAHVSAETLEDVVNREVDLDFESKSLAVSDIEAEMAASRLQELEDRAKVRQGNYNNPKSLQDFVGRMDEQGYYSPSRYQVMFDKTLYYRDAREIQDMMTFQCIISG